MLFFLLFSLLSRKKTQTRFANGIGDEGRNERGGWTRRIVKSRKEVEATQSDVGGRCSSLILCLHSCDASTVHSSSVPLTLRPLDQRKSAEKVIHTQSTGNKMKFVIGKSELNPLAWWKFNAMSCPFVKAYFLSHKKTESQARPLHTFTYGNGS